MAPGMGKTVKRAVFHIHAVYTSLHFAHVSSSAAPASGIIRETQTYVINRKTENRTQKGGFPVNQMFICLIFSVREPETLYSIIQADMEPLGRFKVPYR